MKTKQLGRSLLVFLEPGDELLECVCAAAEQNGVKSALVSGIGAVGELTAGAFNPAEDRYRVQEYKEPLEICSLSGSVTDRAGKPFPHIHIAASRLDGTVVGGHIRRAVVSLAGEIFLTELEGTLERRMGTENGPSPLILD